MLGRRPSALDFYLPLTATVDLVLAEIASTVFEATRICTIAEYNMSYSQCCTHMIDAVLLLTQGGLDFYLRVMSAGNLQGLRASKKQKRITIL